MHAKQFIIWGLMDFLIWKLSSISSQPVMKKSFFNIFQFIPTGIPSTITTWVVRGRWEIAAALPSRCRRLRTFRSSPTFHRSRLWECLWVRGPRLPPMVPWRPTGPTLLMLCILTLRRPLHTLQVRSSNLATNKRTNKQLIMLGRKILICTWQPM